MMKRMFSILSGAGLLGILTYFTIGVFADWYGPRYIRNDEDISFIYLICIVILGVSVITGGIAGEFLHRYLRRRYSGHA